MGKLVHRGRVTVAKMEWFDWGQQVVSGWGQVWQVVGRLGPRGGALIGEWGGGMIGVSVDGLVSA